MGHWTAHKHASALTDEQQASLAVLQCNACLRLLTPTARVHKCSNGVSGPPVLSEAGRARARDLDARRRTSSAQARKEASGLDGGGGGDSDAGGGGVRHQSVPARRRGRDQLDDSSSDDGSEGEDSDADSEEEGRRPRPLKRLRRDSEVRSGPAAARAASAPHAHRPKPPAEAAAAAAGVGADVPPQPVAAAGAGAVGTAPPVALAAAPARKKDAATKLSAAARQEKLVTTFADFVRVAQQGDGGAAPTALRAFLATVDPPTPPPTPHQHLAAGTQAVERAGLHLRQGRIGAASRALDGAPLIDVGTPGVAEEIRAQFPSPIVPCPLPPPPAVSPGTISVPQQVVTEVIAQLNRHTACGASGMDYGHLQDMLAHPQGCDLLTRFVQLYAEERITHPEVRQLLHQKRGVAIGKANGKPRPIAIPEALMQLVDKVLIAIHTSEIAAVLKPYELGIAVRCGTEVAGHAARAYAAVHPDHVVFVHDFKAAFQHVDITSAAHDVHAKAPWLYPYFMTRYGQPDEVVFTGRDGAQLTVQRATGLAQGSPLSPFLFTLATQRCFDPVAGGGVGLLLYADDSTLTGPLPEVAAAVELLRTTSAQVGLVAQPRKCAAYCPAPPSPAAWATFCTEVGLPEGYKNEGVVVTGTPIGTDAFVAAWLADKQAQLGKKADVVLAAHKDLEMNGMDTSRCCRWHERASARRASTCAARCHPVSSRPSRKPTTGASPSWCTTCWPCGRTNPTRGGP